LSLVSREEAVGSIPMAAEAIGMIQETIKTFDQQGNAGGSCNVFADQQKCGGSAEIACSQGGCHREYTNSQGGCHREYTNGT
jgi:hypothetical protein